MKNDPHYLRADRALKSIIPSLCARHIQEAFTHALVTHISGIHLKKGSTISDPSQLNTSALKSHLDRIRKHSTLSVSIIADELDWLVVDKPPGMPSNPISLFDDNTMTHWALQHYPEISDHFPQPQPTIAVHRLDTGTSGLLIIAKTIKGFNYWRQLFKNKQVLKDYWAWCWGTPQEESFVISIPLKRHPNDHTKVITTKNGPTLHTRINIIKRTDTMFLCSAQSSSGFRHQVRAHLSHAGFPLVGDTLYDPISSQRTIQPRHHLLRAIKIQCDKHLYSLELDRLEFRLQPTAEINTF